MILGIGIDLVDVNRFGKILGTFGKDRVFSKFLTGDEVRDFNGDAKGIVRFVAKRFCAKESFSKAVGTGIGRGIDLSDISYLHNDLGMPYIKLSEKATIFLGERFGCSCNIHISSTDEGSFVQCFTIIEKK
ncbi:MAG: holo-ACP synthase [Rickettsiales bacterium]|jgi:holo-[acyl-carrier protein] synthase|nr:holo-ACP synthase [Rickettsiales bacterium]